MVNSKLYRKFLFQIKVCKKNIYKFLSFPPPWFSEQPSLHDTFTGSFSILFLQQSWICSFIFKEFNMCFTLVSLSICLFVNASIFVNIFRIPWNWYSGLLWHIFYWKWSISLLWCVWQDTQNNLEKYILISFAQI